MVIVSPSFRIRSLVVPANAGTNTPRILVLALGRLPFCSTGRQGLWAPAFAGTTRVRDLIDRPDQILDFLGMRSELLGELVEIGIGDRGEAGFVDVGHDLHADRFQLLLRLMLKLDRLRRLLLVDLVGGR